MNKTLEFIENNPFFSDDSEVQTEFKVKTNIVRWMNDKINRGEIILEPTSNNNVSFLTTKENDGSIITKLERTMITPYEPLKLKLEYRENENMFYIDKTVVQCIFEIMGLICYDLSIGEYYTVDYYEPDIYTNEHHYTDLNDIELILLTPDELDEIDNNNYHVILKQTQCKGNISLKELIKYERVNVKLNKPKYIKGTDQEGCFNDIEFRSDF